jgi:hypothetical protein
MASLHNPYFNKSFAGEQGLFNSLKTESIQVLGHMFYYLPRQVVTRDLVLGETDISKFPLAIEIEMYMENVLGFQGEKELYSKFGLEINSSYNLIVSVDRWETEVKSQFDNDQGNGEASFDVLVSGRPQEGDLIYDPLTKMLLEIKFCDHESEFYQVGKNYIYKLSCEAFQYNSEELNTGISDIDSIEDLNSLDMTSYQILLEDGGLLLQENGGGFMQETQEIPEFTSGKISYDNSHEFDVAAEDVSFSASNPFSGM